MTDTPTAPEIRALQAVIEEDLHGARDIIRGMSARDKAVLEFYIETLKDAGPPYSGWEPYPEVVVGPKIASFQAVIDDDPDLARRVVFGMTPKERSVLGSYLNTLEQLVRHEELLVMSKNRKEARDTFDPQSEL